VRGIYTGISEVDRRRRSASCRNDTNETEGTNWRGSGSFTSDAPMTHAALPPTVDATGREMASRAGRISGNEAGLPRRRRVGGGTGR